MATIAQGSTRNAAERRFYSRMALFMIAVVFIGFAPSFYLRGLVQVPRPNPTLPPSVMLHGIVFTLWMLLFIAQTQLVSASRRDLHMKLGAFGMLLGASMIPLIYLTAVWQVARANQPPLTDPLNWTAVPLSVIPAFAILLWVGWSRRREPQSHKRAMLCAGLLMMEPAIHRFPVIPPDLFGFLLASLAALACFVPLVLWDRRSLGHVHRVTMLGIAVFVLAVATQLALIITGSWAPIAARLPGVGA
jgi:hypothetical protein